VNRFPETDRTRIKRAPHKGSLDRAEVYDILDEALICQVGFVHDGSPVVVPTIHGREGDMLYLHGSRASRMLRTLRTGTDIAVSATLLDGLVLARSLFHSSMHYRSVTLFGKARETDAKEKLHGLKVITDRTLPGRWDHARAPSDKELKATTVLAIPIAEASAKISSGPPNDDDEDYDLDFWAGVVPLRLVAGEPKPDPRLDDKDVPDHVRKILARFPAKPGF
jgi:nitroimidazol reductase NimA-like FMN-containing flavoprotein (pyridoxamine 5'-phosphate oxidase superfamily)